MRRSGPIDASLLEATSKQKVDERGISERANGGTQGVTNNIDHSALSNAEAIEENEGTANITEQYQMTWPRRNRTLKRMKKIKDNNNKPVSSLDTPKKDSYQHRQQNMRICSRPLSLETFVSSTSSVPCSSKEHIKSGSGLQKSNLNKSKFSSNLQATSSFRLRPQSISDKAVGRKKASQNQQDEQIGTNAQLQKVTTSLPISTSAHFVFIT